MQVLIVDDDPISLRVLEHALAKSGYEVVAAESAEEALALMHQRDLRLVISDWDMPGLDGLGFCREVRRNDFGGYVYFILLTGRNSSAEIVEGLSAGADDFIAKPFNAAELVVRVRSGERVLALETREVAIFALAKLAESRDPETGYHLERVRSYSRILAEQLATMPGYADQIDAEFVSLIYQTSPLHDIGKVAIPDAVLLNPGKLNAEEFAIMQKHAAFGAHTLDEALRRYPQARFLRIARDIALTHHERWNGKGYPNGLRGEEIPLAGRIVAVADVYDALTSVRRYKRAFEHSEARSILVRDSGSHFDPGIIDAFLACEGKFLEIRDRFAEPAAELASV
jgi:putative two-component system response regulator